MDYKIESGVLKFRLDPGEEVISSIQTICQNESIYSGTVQGIGAIREVTLRYFKQREKDFKELTLEDEFEVTSFMGNISQNNSNPYLHCHIVLGTNDFTSRSGHCHEAIVGATFEGIIYMDQLSVGRKYSEKIGLNLFDFS